MNQAVPVSMNGDGFTVTGPAPQSTVASASTRDVTRATAGLARSTACWTMIWSSDAELSARVGAGTARVGADTKRKDKSTESLTNGLIICARHQFTGPP